MRCGIVSIWLLAVAIPAAANDGATITGTALDYTGVGIAGATVALGPLRTPRNYVATGKTDGVGVYVLGTLRAGDYVLEVGAPGFQTIHMTVRVEADESKTMPEVRIPLASYACIGPERAPRMLYPGSSDAGGLSGLVAERDKPLSRAVVTLVCAENRACGRAVTGYDGTFHFGGLVPGVYSLRIDHRGFRRLQGDGYLVSREFRSEYGPFAPSRCLFGVCLPKVRLWRPVMHCE